jgi:hypothetical protein
LRAFEKTTPPIEKLLNQPIRELGLKVEGSPLERFVHQMYRELEAKGIRRFKPQCYLSSEWGCPSGEPVIAIPFYLANPELAQLEKEMDHLEDSREIMMYLRHEAGHAFNYAYKLYDTHDWRELFGPFRRPYREDYRPVPFSRRYVRHIAGWYAQKHPDEDFAETFAVWMTPDAQWRERYRDWPAIKKLKYMDELMGVLAGKTPSVSNTDTLDPLPSLKKTLRQHYRRKRRHYGIDYPSFYDRDLRRLFSDAPEFSQRMTAAQLLTKLRKPVRKLVSNWTGIYQYTIDQVFEDMIERCQKLNLRLAVSEDQARAEFAVLLTVQAMNYLQSGGHRVAL